MGTEERHVKGRGAAGATWKRRPCGVSLYAEDTGREERASEAARRVHALHRDAFPSRRDA